MDSAILCLVRREKCLLPTSVLAEYHGFVALGFGEVGGSLHASLRRAYPRGRVDAAFAEAELDRRTVVAFVHPDQWVTLFRKVHGLRA